MTNQNTQTSFDFVFYARPLSEATTKHPPEVLERAQALTKYGIKGALGAAYAARPMR